MVKKLGRKSFDDDFNQEVDGLTQQLADTTKKVTASATAPADPRLNDVWIDVSYTPVQSTSPANNGYKPLDGMVTFTFDKWLDDNITGKVKLYPTDADRAAGTNEIAGTITRASNKKLTFKPSVNLTTQSMYYVRLLADLPFADGFKLGKAKDLQFKAIDFINANFESWDAVNVKPTGWTKTVSGTTTDTIVEQVSNPEVGGNALHLKAGNAAASNAIVLTQRAKKADVLALGNVTFKYKNAESNPVDRTISIAFEFRNSGDTAAQLRITGILNGNVPAETASAKFIDLRSMVVSNTWSDVTMNLRQKATAGGFNFDSLNDCDITITVNANTANVFLECYFDNIEFLG